MPREKITTLPIIRIERPNEDNPAYIRGWNDAIRAAADLFDGNPRSGLNVLSKQAILELEK